MRVSKFTLFLLFLPTILALLLIFVLPLMHLVRLSFTDASIGKNINFIGLANYREFLYNADLWFVLQRTILWTLLGVLLKIGIGLGGALLLNVKLGYRGFYRAMVLPPWVMPLSISAIVWTWLLNGQFGLISNLLQHLSIISEPFEFLGSRNPAFFSVLLVDVWAGVPLISTFLIAALESIPVDSLEAASIEGASRLQKMRLVIIPQILPVILSLTVVTTIFTFNSFDVIWIMTRGGPSDGTSTLPILAYRTSIQRFNFGLGAAQSVVMSLGLFALVTGYLVLRKGVQKNAEY